MYSFIVTASNRLGESSIDDNKKQAVEIPAKTTASTTPTFDDRSVNKTSTGDAQSFQTSASNFSPVIVLGVLFAVLLSFNAIFLVYFILRHRKETGNKENLNTRNCANYDIVYLNSMHPQDKQPTDDNIAEQYQPVDNNRQQEPSNTTIYQSVSPQSDRYSSLGPGTKLPPQTPFITTSGFYEDIQAPSHQYQALDNARRK